MANKEKKVTYLRIARGVFVAALWTVASSASAAVVTWTDWTSISSTSATGTMGGVSVSVASANMNGPSQTGAGCGTSIINYWTQPNPADLAYTGGTVSNAPTPCEQVGLNSATSVTVTFGSAINNLYMALLSVGRPTVAVTYDFDHAFIIDSEGAGYFGNDTTNGVIGAGDTLTGREFHGLLRFTSPVTTLTFGTTEENWHAFTFGTIPEPATLALLGLGLAGLAATRRRKQ